MTQSIDIARLTLMLNDLRLPAIKQDWPALAERADKESWPAARFLATLAEHEIAERDRRRLARHLAEAQLLPGKTLDSFDFDVVPMISKAHVLAICAGDSWIDKGANLLLIGGPGGGKTHLAAAIGLALVENGWRVLFARTSDLVQTTPGRAPRTGARSRHQPARSLPPADPRRPRLCQQGSGGNLRPVRADQRPLRTSIHLDHRQSAVRRLGQGLSRSRHDARRRRSPRSPRHDLRDQRRQLSATRRPRAQTKGRRTTAKLRDNQGPGHRVAPRQSNSNLALASDNQTKHHRLVAIIRSHPDRRALSSRLSRYNPHRRARELPQRRRIGIPQGAFVALTAAHALPPHRPLRLSPPAFARWRRAPGREFAPVHGSANLR